MFTDTHAKVANELRKNTLMAHLDIHFYVKDGALWAAMPVCAKTAQPMGLLHGGATAALAESLGSLASALLIDLNTQKPVGTHVSAKHLKAVHSGTVHAKAILLRKGKTLHIWDIHVFDDYNDLVASCSLTNMLITIE